MSWGFFVNQKYTGTVPTALGLVLFATVDIKKTIIMQKCMIGPF